MRRVFRLLSPMVCIALFAGFAAPALALSPKQMESLLEESSSYARDALGKAEEAPAGKRREMYDAIIARIDQDMALCTDAKAELLADWGDLYVDLAKETSNDIAFVFLDKALPIFEKARDRDRKEEHAWTGLAEVHHVRAEKLFEAGQEEEARKQAEQGFTMFKEGEKYCPNSNFLYYMWGSNLVLRAYDVEGAERIALRVEGIAKFARAAEIEPDDQYALRMAGTANLRMAEDMSGESAERTRLLREAESWYKKAFVHDPDGTCRPLAEAQALLQDENSLRATLEQCARRDRLPDLDKEPYNFVRTKDWFHKLTAAENGQ